MTDGEQGEHLAQAQAGRDQGGLLGNQCCLSGFCPIMMFSTGTALEECTVYEALLRVLTQPDSL